MGNNDPEVQFDDGSIYEKEPKMSQCRKAKAYFLKILIHTRGNNERAKIGAASKKHRDIKRSVYCFEVRLKNHHHPLRKKVDARRKNNLHT